MTSEAVLWMRRVRILLGMIILILSIALLIWGFLPARHEIRSQPISPTELQLPTPASFRFDTASPWRRGDTSPLSASFHQPKPVF